MDNNNQFGNYDANNQNLHSYSENTQPKVKNPYEDEMNNDPFANTTANNQNFNSYNANTQPRVNNPYEGETSNDPFANVSNTINTGSYSTYYNEGPNLPLAIVGAIIGSIPGCILWFVIGRLNFIAGIAGFAIMFGSLKLSEILGKGLNKAIIIMCIAVTCVMIFVTNYTDYALQLCQMATDEGYEISFFQALEIMPNLFKEFPEVQTGFIFNLIIGYALTGFSCFKSLKNLM